MAVNQISDRELTTIADYQQLIDDIESLMASPVEVDVEQVSRLHANFEVAVKTVNARLRECDQLLKKGLRNEALERGGVEPNLLELFLLIDFPERESWADTVRQCGLAPTDLLVSVAAELTDAQASEKPLADLKYQVRLHALARSPLPIRMMLMRRLSKLDKNTTVWDEDLKFFEVARHNQLASEIQSAIKAGNPETLSNLFEELQISDWQSPPAPNLSKQVSDALSQLRRQKAREEMRQLEPELTTAFAAFDVSRGRELRESWQQWAKFAAFPASDPLLQIVAPTLQWLVDQDQQERQQLAYDKAIAGLSSALDKGEPRLVLEEKYHALMGLALGIPDDLKQRLEERLRRLDAEKGRALKLKIAGVAVVLLLVCGVVAFFYSNASFRRQVLAEAAILQKMLDEKQFSEANEYLSALEKQSPKVAATEEIQKIKVDLTSALEGDSVRKLNFKSLMDAAKKDGVDQASFKSITNASKSLSKAWEVASPAEKAEVEELTKQVEQTRQTLKEQFAREFQSKEERFAQLRDAPLDNVVAIQQLKVDVAAMIDQEGVGDDLLPPRAKPLFKEIDQKLKDGEKNQSEARLVLQIAKSVGDMKFFDELRNYVNSSEFAGTKRSNDFKRVVEFDTPLVTGYLQWSSFLESRIQRDLTSLDASTATKLRTEYEHLVKAHPGFPYALQLRDAVDYLSKSSAREQGSLGMEQLLARKMFKVYSVRDSEQTYYLPAKGPMKDKSGSLQIKYYLDTEFKETKSARLTSPENESDWHSPQMAFEADATKLLNELRNDKGTRWDQTFIQLLGKLYNSSEMDPILKIQLIPYILKQAGIGSSFLPKRVERVKSEIERENLNPGVNWVVPSDAEAVKVREQANTLLKRIGGDLRDTKPLLAEADKAMDAIRRPRLDAKYLWNGWLHKDSDSKWTCTFRGNAPLNKQGGDLFVLVKADSGEVTFVKIGKVQQGRTTVDPGQKELTEGRPVFEKKQDGSTTK